MRHSENKELLRAAGQRGWQVGPIYSTLLGPWLHTRHRAHVYEVCMTRKTDLPAQVKAVSTAHLVYLLIHQRRLCTFWLFFVMYFILYYRAGQYDLKSVS